MSTSKPGRNHARLWMKILILMGGWADRVELGLGKGWVRDKVGLGIRLG